jgi:hypothetical protein
MDKTTGAPARGKNLTRTYRVFAFVLLAVALLGEANQARADAAQCAPALLTDASGVVLGQATRLSNTTVQATPCRGTAVGVAFLVVEGNAYKVAPNEVVIVPGAAR